MPSDLGKIAITMNGTYDNTKTYERLSCVKYYRSSWISMQEVPAATNDEEKELYVPKDNSAYWQKITDDGNTMTIVRYDVVVPVEDWITSTKYDTYKYQASFEVDGITASSICQVIFDLTELTSNNFAPVCDSYYGGITIYSKKKPSSAIKIPSILANKYYDVDSTLGTSATTSITKDVENLASQLSGITTNVIDVQQSTIFVQNIPVSSGKWKTRSSSASTTNSFNYFAEISIKEECGLSLDDADNFGDNYTATVVYAEEDAASMIFSPVVSTSNKGTLTGYTNQPVITLYAKTSAKETDITIPLIKLEKVSQTTLQQNNVAMSTTSSES